ncbi:MAG: hypothetical protein JWO81_710, partial [Alphaproteobacteria bacterium]|nr:hypothetical protein [Alphaproteobacteria bacterium]
GKVWRALADGLDKLKIKHTNGRVGAYGPDLRCASPKRLLFEIKTDCSPASVYEAVGQLFLYEKILQEQFQKIAVLPETGLCPELGAAVKSLGIDVLRYGRKGSAIKIDAKNLKRQFQAPAD